MLYMAKVACQARDNDGRVRTFMANETFDFKKPPTEANWVCIEYITLDLASVTLEILLETQWHEKDLIEYAKKNFKVDLKAETKTQLAQKFIDARFRHEGTGHIKKDLEAKSGQIVGALPKTEVKQDKTLKSKTEKDK